MSDLGGKMLTLYLEAEQFSSRALNLDLLHHCVGSLFPPSTIQQMSGDETQTSMCEMGRNASRVLIYIKTDKLAGQLRFTDRSKKATA